MNTWCPEFGTWINLFFFFFFLITTWFNSKTWIHIVGNPLPISSLKFSKFWSVNVLRFFPTPEQVFWLFNTRSYDCAQFWHCTTWRQASRSHSLRKQGPKTASTTKYQSQVQVVTHASGWVAVNQGSPMTPPWVWSRLQEQLTELRKTVYLHSSKITSLL